MLGFWALNSRRGLGSRIKTNRKPGPRIRNSGVSGPLLKTFPVGKPIKRHSIDKIRDSSYIEVCRISLRLAQFHPKQGVKFGNTRSALYIGAYPSTRDLNTDSSRNHGAYNGRFRLNLSVSILTNVAAATGAFRSHAGLLLDRLCFRLDFQHAGPAVLV